MYVSICSKRRVKNKLGIVQTYCYNTLMQKIINFFKEVRSEFKQISWPKRESIIQSTIVVISISIVVSLILGGFDYIFTQSIGFLGQLTQVENTPETIDQNQIPSITTLPSISLEPTIEETK